VEVVKRVTCRSRLTRPTGVGTWTFAIVPAAAAREGGFKARMRVVGTIDGAPFRSTLMPRGGGTVFVVVPKALRERIGKSSGEEVALVLSPDVRPIVLAVPPDFQRALGTDRARFDTLAPSRRKAFLQWVESAKQAETRTRRISKALDMVRRGETLH
jgi:hypothetical protein